MRDPLIQLIRDDYEQKGTAWTPDLEALIKGVVERFFNALESEGQGLKPILSHLFLPSLAADLVFEPAIYGNHASRRRWPQGRIESSELEVFGAPQHEFTRRLARRQRRARYASMEIEPMNRQTRRAAKATARQTSKSKYHEIVAVHEAGHAVAKVMAAPDFGYEVHEAVSYIDVGSQGPGNLAPDGKMILRSQGVTYGPVFSKEISLAAAEFLDGCFADRASPAIEGNDRCEFFGEF
jgi:hypothetical protein